MKPTVQINRTISEKKKELEAIAASSRAIVEERSSFTQEANAKIGKMNQQLGENEMKAHEVKGAIDALETLRSAK